MGKKVTIIMFSLFLFLICMTMSASAAQLCIPDMSADNGASVQIPFNVDNATGIAGYQVTITYNSAGAVLNCTGTVAGSLTSGWLKNQNLTVPNQITVGGVQPDLIPLTGGSGSLVKLSCTVVGNPGATTNVCISSKKLSDENGAEITSTVCDDGCGIFTVGGPVPYFCDKDADTHYSESQDGTCTEGPDCPPAGCQLTAGDDCNDNDNAIYPGAAEICDNKDNDCNAETVDGSGDPQVGQACDGPDTDLCLEGTNSCIAGAIVCSDNTGNTLDVCDGQDNDCNPSTADGSGDTRVGQACDGPDTDLCLEGTNSCIAGAIVCSDNTGNTLDVCDGQDNDCNPATADGSGDPMVGQACDGPDTDLCMEGTNSCVAGAIVCSDNTTSTLDVCDGLDNDCDPASADGSEDPMLGQACDGDDPDLCPDGVYICSAGSLICNDGPGTAPDVCDGQDNDCNPATADGSGDTRVGQPCDGPDTDLCMEGTNSCIAGAIVCSDNTGNTLDVCDGQDNDCNPATADGSGDPIVGQACDGPDTDLCMEGTNSCVAGAIVCSDNTGNNLDVCDGQDNDCNPATADGSGDPMVGQACDGPDTDQCKEGVYACTSGTLSCTDNTGDAVEVCTGGVDEDCDGLIDLNDPDCVVPQKVVSIPDDLSGCVGEVVSVPVNVDDASGIAGFQCDVSYDPAVLNCTDADVGDLTEGWMIQSNTTEGMITFGGLDPTLAGLTNGSGSLAVLSCQVMGETGMCTSLDLVCTLADSEGSDIPSTEVSGYLCVDVCAMIPAEVDIDPNTLNVKSVGNFITAYITLMEPYDVKMVNISSIVLNDGDTFVAAALSSPVGMSDSDTLMVKFDRATVIDYLKSVNKTATSVEFTITGSLTTGETFEGYDMVNVIDPPKKK